MEELFTKYGYRPDRDAIEKHIELLAANLDKVASEKAEPAPRKAMIHIQTMAPGPP